MSIVSASAERPFKAAMILSSRWSRSPATITVTSHRTVRAARVASGASMMVVSLFERQTLADSFRSGIDLAHALNRIDVRVLF
jgi:hypothetical protein